MVYFNFLQPELRKFIRKTIARKKRGKKKEATSRSPSPPLDAYYPWNFNSFEAVCDVDDDFEAVSNIKDDSSDNFHTI